MSNINDTSFKSEIIKCSNIEQIRIRLNAQTTVKVVYEARQNIGKCEIRNGLL